MASTRWLSDSEQDAWRTYIHATNRILDSLGHALESDPEIDLALAEYEILVKLSEAPGHALIMSELADKVVHSRSRTAHTVSRLEKRGYVMREAAAARGESEDCRRRYAVLRDEGMRALEAAAPTHVESVREVLVDPLGSERFEELGRMMQTILARLDAER